MIEVSSAFAGVEDSTSVSLEDGGVSFDGDGGWSLGNGSLQGSDALGLDVDVGFNVDLTLRGIEFA